ncbi:hypothetical protein IGI04_019474, partial [Brassica rapa subsp. trilocularis]
MAIQRRLEGDSKEFFTFSHGRGFLVIPRGVSCQRVYFPAAIGINLKDFQNILGDLQKSLENILFSKKSSKKICVFLGFGISALLISNQGSCSLRTCRANSLFLLLMDENLAEVLKGMSLGEDKSIIIPEDDDFCAIERGGRSILGRLLNPEQHHNDHVDKLMPLMAPTIPPGFEPPPSIVAPEVFEQMRLYMECVDPEERRIREAKMRKTLQELSTDPIAQRSCLRLERAPVISADINRDRGRVFDFSRVGTDAILNVAESSSYGSQRRVDLLEDGEIRRTMGTVSTKRVGENTNLEQRQREDAQNEPRYPRKEVRHNDARLGGSQLVNERDRGFVMGAETSNGSERSSRSRNTSSSRSSWTRHNQNKRRVTQRWSTQPAVCDIIKKHWRPVERSDGRDVTSVISSCRKDLAQWKRSDAGNSKKQIMQLRLQLEGEEKK